LLDGASELTGRELDPESAACEVAMPAVEDLALVERNRDLQALVPDVLEQRRGLGVGHGWEGRRNRMSRIGDGLRGGGRPRHGIVEPRGCTRGWSVFRYHHHRPPPLAQRARRRSIARSPRRISTRRRRRRRCRAEQLRRRHWTAIFLM